MLNTIWYLEVIFSISLRGRDARSVGDRAERAVMSFLLPGLQENKRMKQSLEEEQKSRKELERVVRRLAKQKNDCEDSSH